MGNAAQIVEGAPVGRHEDCYGADAWSFPMGEDLDDPIPYSVSEPALAAFVPESAPALPAEEVCRWCLREACACEGRP